MSTTINGANIATGTITANKINLSSLSQAQAQDILQQTGAQTNAQTNAFFQASQISQLGFQTTALTSVSADQIQGNIEQINNPNQLLLTTNQKQQIAAAITDATGLNQLIQQGQTVAVELSNTAITGGKIILQTNGLILTDQAFQVQSQSTIVLNTTQQDNAITIYNQGTPRVILGKIS